MRTAALVAILALALAGCGGGTKLLPGHSTTVSAPPVVVGVPAQTGHAAAGLGFPAVATKNTTRVPGADPVTDAAVVALAVYPSAAPGTHPPAVVLAPTDDWQAALAASVLMAPPIRAPILLSSAGSLPPATQSALAALAPTGSGSAGGAQLIRIGDVPKVAGLRAAAIGGSDPYALTAAIDRFSGAAHGQPSGDVVIAPGDNAAYAMPAAGWAAESGEPILYVTHAGVPAATRQALLGHQRTHLYVLAPSSVIPDSVLATLGRYGAVKRISATDPPSSSVAFAIYRDPPCPADQPCAHVPGSFGWAIRSPGHGYVLLNAARPLDAAAAAALSGSGSYGPQLVLENASTLPSAVLNFFLNYATPGFTQEGPTAAVYNHGWIIGDTSAVSVGVQAQVDSLLEAVPQK